MHGSFTQIGPDGKFEHIGPEYPELGATVAKYRRKARGGISDLSRDEVIAYADAIESAIRSKQRAALQREFPTHQCNCASGTNHNTGEAIHKAMQAKQRAALIAECSRVRRQRTEQEWRDMYEEAMAAKRKT